MPGYINKNKLFAILIMPLLMYFHLLMRGFGIPLIEAMRAQVPVICSDIEVFKEIGMILLFILKTRLS